LAAVSDAAGYPEIGRCDKGQGVELLLHGAPATLGGWDHFNSFEK
jgi:hypothetical protein